MTIVKLNLQLFTLTTVPAALVRKGWAKDTWMAALNNIYFNKFMGKDASSIIRIQDELNKEPGDNVTIPLLLKLAGAGVTGDSTLEGNEEALQYRDFNVQINQYRNAVLLSGRLEEQKSALKLRTDAKAALQNWLTELIDGMFFTALSANPTAGRKVFAGSNTAEATIAEADKFTAALIGKAKRIAQMDPTSKIQPVKVNGANHFVMIVDPYQARDLKNDPAWVSAQESANIRGETNPIFTGALGMWDNVVIHENEQCKRTSTGASSLMVGHALFLGAQAGVMATAQDTKWVEKDFDYDNKTGFAISRILGIAKTQYKFNGTDLVDFATVNVMTASKAD
ncbi:MAG: N4-gp56 family major capsid protein [Selenomonadaceae bacterium]